MKEERYEVRTTEGNLTNRGFEGGGLSHEDALRDADKRNKKSVVMGLEVRYEVRPLGDAA